MSSDDLIRSVTFKYIGQNNKILYKWVVKNDGNILSNSNSIVNGFRAIVDMLNKPGDINPGDVKSIDIHVNYAFQPLTKDEKKPKPLKQKTKRIFCLKQRGQEMPGWWEKKGDKWINCDGGYHSQLETDKILHSIESDDWDTLFDIPEVKRLNRQMCETYLLNKDSRLGWVTPDGKFYPCHYADHDNVIFYMFGISVGDAEKQGYIRVGKEMYQRTKIGTIPRAQRKTLIDLGFLDPENCFRDE